MTMGDPSNVFVPRYEALRCGALGQPVAPELRGGLAVLLQRGVVAWMRVVAADTSSSRCPSPAGDLVQPREHRDLIHRLADLTSGHLRRHP